MVLSVLNFSLKKFSGLLSIVQLSRYFAARSLRISLDIVSWMLSICQPFFIVFVGIFLAFFSCVFTLLFIVFFLRFLSIYGIWDFSLCHFFRFFRPVFLLHMHERQKNFPGKDFLLRQGAPSFPINFANLTIRYLHFFALLFHFTVKPGHFISI